jgi:3-oxoacyl-[acyl-carrier-protein] synthase II
MDRRRVVVTGIGAVTPVGITRKGMWDGMLAQRSAVRSVTRFDPSEFRSHNAAEVRDFDPADFLDRKRAKRLDLFGQYSVTAARLAVADSELVLERERRERIGANMGTALGGVGFAEAQCRVYFQHGLRHVDPGLALMVFGGASSCNIAIDLGVQGPNSTNAMSCASGTIAVGNAFRAIRDDDADVMLCGGAEAPLSPLCFGAFSIIRAMSSRNDEPEASSRPFDRDRDGFVMGEGAVVLVLEERGRALARGAPVYAEILGFGSSNDAHHMTAPLPDASMAAYAMQRALSDARVNPEEIGYINAHGSSTPLNDVTETRAIKRVFGERSYQIPVSGTKGYYGHALGASGAFEAGICSLALQSGWLPPTVNLSTPDEGCDLDYVPSHGRNAGVDTLLSNSFGFGGINASLVMRRAD